MTVGFFCEGYIYIPSLVAQAKAVENNNLGTTYTILTYFPTI
jgi:hypothetical protein